jgi:hypothetical protein
MFVDPAISRRKFDREIEQFRAERKSHHRRGVWLMDATFPDAFFILTATQTKPYPMVAFGVVINFENYDVEPPSVRFVHPVTGDPLKKRELPHLLVTEVKRVMVAPGQIMEAPNRWLANGFDEEVPAFVCLQGVREYHNHPGHSGDSWWLHRKGGAGTLFYIVDQLARYGVDGIRGVQIQLQPKIGEFFVQAPQ